MQHFKRFFLILLLTTGFSVAVLAWGFWGHHKINHQACFTLPPEMFSFYKKHIEYLTEHAVDPDKRRYFDPKEAPRHYIDIDHYGEHPFDSVPEYWNDAVAKFTEDTLNAYGIVPWYILKMEYRLTEAFKEKDADKILYLSAFIGHYIADAHVPLHCTENYNGQLTNQSGIHAFWESRIPELYGDDYDYLVGRVEYIEHPQQYIWNVVKGSFAALDSVLSFEKQLSATFPSDKKYSFEQKGSTMQKSYSQDYTAAYDQMLDGMVERRMRAAVLAVGSFWYTAWVNAGSPDLSQLDNKEVSEEMKKKIQEEDKLWRTGKPVEEQHKEE